MKFEVLYPEFGNLFGDSWNYRYLKECLQEFDEFEYIETHYNDIPALACDKVDLIYMGTMTENQQELIIEKLLPYKIQIEKMIQDGVIFIMTGNAGEVFCDYIENEDGSRIEGLGIIPLHAKRNMMQRFNSAQICQFEGMKLVGFKAEFSQLYGDNSRNYFADVEYGCGINAQSKLEGIRLNNFFSTSMVGPFLVMNPLFVKYIMHLCDIESPILSYEDVIMAAYERRLSDLERMKAK